MQTEFDVDQAKVVADLPDCRGYMHTATHGDQCLLIREIRLTACPVGYMYGIFCTKKIHLSQSVTLRLIILVIHVDL